MFVVCKFVDKKMSSCFCVQICTPKKSQNVGGVRSTPKCKVNKYIDNIYCLIPNVDNLYYTSKVIREIIGRFFYKTI